jgi:lipopolysaccharide export system protein LptA
VPEGALVKFDQPLDLARGKIGNVVAGNLCGPFLIRSDQKSPGPDDDLWIAARDAELVDNRVVSPHPIEFRLGNSYGSGTAVRIDLSSSKNDGAARNMAFDGISAFELKRDVVMHLDVNQAGMAKAQGLANPLAMAGQAAAATGAADAGLLPMPVSSPAKPDEKNGDKPDGKHAQPPIQISCQGPFRFDLTKYVATFQDQVDVLRLNAQGPSDQLRGELLSLFFAAVAPERNPAEGPAPPAAPGRLPKLEPVRLEVRGMPVVMHSPSEDVDARGELLRYDLKSRRVSLEGTGPVMLRQGINHIEAPRLFYEPTGGPLGGEPTSRSRFGKFSAVGPGFLEAAPPDDPTRLFRAEWTEQLHFGPENDEHVVSLLGDAKFEQPGAGSLKGAQVFVWLREQKDPGTGPRTRTAAHAPATDRPRATAARPTAKMPRLMPDRMLATGNVRLEAQPIICEVEKLQVWFVAAAPTAPGRSATAVGEELPEPGGEGTQRQPPVAGYELPTPPGADGIAATPTAGPAAPGGLAGLIGQPGARGAAPTRFHVTGQQLQVELRMVGQQVELSQIRVQERVKMRELVAAPTAEAPLLLVGDQVEYVERSLNDGTATVIGAPAHVEGRGLVLDGYRIELDRGRNLLSVLGAGRLQLPPPQRDMTGQPVTSTTPLSVEWQGKMNFDGLRATFVDRVVGQFDQRTLRTGEMQVAFDEKIDFANPPRDRQPEWASLACRGGVRVEGQTRRAAVLESVEQMRAADFSVRRVDGYVHASGPGWLSAVRRGGAALLPGAAGAPGAGSGAAGMMTTAMRPAEGQPGSGELTYVKVEFQTLATGNINLREMTFGNRVRTTVGPVENFQQAVNSDDFDRSGYDGRPRGARGVFMTSERLTIAQAPGVVAGQTSMELDAAGNAEIEGLNFDGQSFFARATHLKYSQAKDLVILEGDGRTDAELSRQERIGAPVNSTQSRKILYWRTTGRVQVDDAQHFDFDMLPEGHGSQPAPPLAPPAAAPALPRYPELPYPQAGPKPRMPGRQ